MLDLFCVQSRLQVVVRQSIHVPGGAEFFEAAAWTETLENPDNLDSSACLACK